MRPGKQDDGKFAGGMLRAWGAGVDAAPACLEDGAEYERIDAEHEQRRQQRPQHAERRAAVSAGDLSLDELANARSMGFPRVIEVG